MQLETATTDDEEIEIKLEPRIVFTRLTETVRNHYRNYLEKQLKENVRVWSTTEAEATAEADSKIRSRHALAEHNIPQCAKNLEEQAVRACMMAQIYQRTMVKIIANVHDYTQSCHLESHLQKMNSQESCSGSDLAPSSPAKLPHKSSQTTTFHTASKSTQTEAGALRKHTAPATTHRITARHSLALPQPPPPPPPPPHAQQKVPPAPPPSHADDYTSLSLQQKIEMFQARLNKEKAAEVAAYRKHAAPPPHNAELRRTPRHKRRRTTAAEVPSAPSTSSSRQQLQTAAARVPAPSSVQTPLHSSTRSPTPTPTANSVLSFKTEFNDSLLRMPTSTPAPTPTPAPEPEEDLIAQALEQIFSEDQTELDEIFGTCVPNDDPQICSILREIENAKVPQERPKTTTTTTTSPASSSSPPPTSRAAAVAAQIEAAKSSFSSPVASSNRISVPSPPPQPPTRRSEDVVENRPSTSAAAAAAAAAANAELHRSLWPCELFMQRRRLSASLSRLIEEDFRWHELIKWKFATLFGEDSDDEFAACSPSIELDEVLISSCIRRISPWMVKYLMTPMRDGLIANRFLFKKLAKRLGRSIVMENQYPGERTIKHAVEKYFCLHQAVMSIDDLADIPSISFNDED